VNKLDWNKISVLDTGQPRPARYKTLAELAPVILVGLTGAGKTTALNVLAEQGQQFTLLPNRRSVTDIMIIGWLQQESGQEPQPVTDRLARFEYTARYRARFPGGLAHALSRLVIDTADIQSYLIFDGLRGLEEVRYATVYVPQARFVVLDAPDMVRLARLLNRGDAFDTAAVGITPGNQDLIAALTGIPHWEVVFTPQQLQEIAAAVQNAQLPGEDVGQKVSIIVKERHNYDSAAALNFLSQELPPHRLLVVDTAAEPPEAIARRLAGWLASRNEP